MDFVVFKARGKTNEAVVAQALTTCLENLRTLCFQNYFYKTFTSECMRSPILRANRYLFKKKAEFRITKIVPFDRHFIAVTVDYFTPDGDLAAREIYEFNLYDESDNFLNETLEINEQSEEHHAEPDG